MKEMKELVEDHSKLYRHYPQSTVSIATCIQPPKFSSFHLPPNATDLGHWILPITFLNRAEQISSLNKMIKELYGMNYFKSGTKQHKFDTKTYSYSLSTNSVTQNKKYHFSSYY